MGKIPADVAAMRAAQREARIKRFKEGEDWQHGTISLRHYPSYEDYVSHQTSKLERIRDDLEATAEGRIARFCRRFELLDLRPASSVLCLGARLGQEVQAFLSLGHFAVGNDLNPGEGNRYVVTGDFHHLVFADRSVDCVYINSVDHILDLQRFTSEIKRVMKPDGIFVADIVAGYEEGFWAGEFEVMHWPTAAGFARHLADVGGLTLESVRGLSDHGSPNWFQCIFRAGPAAAARA
jgi:SAM-dependent methyltransferase